MPHYIWDRFVYTWKIGIACLKIVSTVPKIWRAVPVFLARVNGVVVCAEKGCLPLTWANRSIHGLNFAPEIAFTICTNQFHSPENVRERPEWLNLKKWKTNFCLEYSLRKKGLPFQMFRCSRKCVGFGKF